jgi:hypothetical protein
MPFWKQRMRPPIDSPERETELKAAMILEVQRRFVNKETFDGIPRFSIIVGDVLNHFGITGEAKDASERKEEQEARRNRFREFLISCPELQDIHEESNRLLAERKAAAKEEEKRIKREKLEAARKKHALGGRTDPDAYEPDELTRQLLRETEARDKNPNTYKGDD